MQLAELHYFHMVLGQLQYFRISLTHSDFQGLKRVIPDCRTGRLLIQSNVRTGEPELHYLKLPENINKHDSVLLLDPQMSSGGGAPPKSLP